jgi:5-methyltetrahydropteroyltriglutamate--homocysteine methyltransferase
MTIVSERTQPPFRADMVGSLLRSAPLKDARAKHENGEITAQELKAIEDREIDTVIRKQQEVGLKLATDGEYRRSRWQYDFLWNLTASSRSCASRARISTA